MESIEITKLILTVFVRWAESLSYFVPMAGRGGWAEALLELLMHSLGRVGRVLDWESPTFWVEFGILLALIIGLGLLYRRIRRKSADK